MKSFLKELLKSIGPAIGLGGLLLLFDVPGILVNLIFLNTYCVTICILRPNSDTYKGMKQLPQILLILNGIWLLALLTIGLPVRYGGLTTPNFWEFQRGLQVSVLIVFALIQLCWLVLFVRKKK